MLMDWDYLCEKYLRDSVTGIVHCGAYLVEEAPDYALLDVPVWWIEANPNLIPEIENRLALYPKQQVIQALLSDVSDQELTFHISGPGYKGSSSVLEWGTHRNFSPLDWVDHIPLTSTTLDRLWEEHGFVKANMVVTDLQGLDGAVLSAAGCLLEHVNWVMCETNVDEVYKGAMLLPDVDRLLANVDPGPPFERVETYLVPGQGWGDVLFRRTGQL